MKGETNGQGVVPLRTILRNILNLIDSFEARYKEGLDSYDQEFQELKQYSENLKTDPGYLCKEGEKSVNRKKNRYKDILPFDYTRVILADYGDIPGSDYINANFIKGASGSSAYIACQGPLPHTVNDFWRMVVECEVQVIVMACNEQESGKHKCENYWVEEEGVEREFGQVTVWLKKSRQVCPDFLVRTMKIRYPNSKGESEERSVCQFHYSAWPDHGVPLKVRPLLDMVRLIRDCQTSETLPVLVHCSAGCGRTGTICAIDYVWGLLRLGKLTSDFSLFNLVRDMRRQRIAMVQTKDQYILVHRAVRELFEEQLKIIDSHPYANVDINGLPLEIRTDLEEPVYETVQFVPSPVRKDEDVVDCRKPVKALPPPIPSEPFVHSSKHEKEVENHERHLEQEKVKITVGTSSSSSTSIKVNSTTPSPSSESQGCASGSENKDLLDQEKDIISLPDEKIEVKKGSGNGKQGSKSSLLRNPSIVRLKAFFEKSKDPDKEKKTIPTLSRAKSDVSSSSRFYTNFANTFASRASRRNSPKNTSPTSQGVSSIEEPRERTPVEKIKSKPALLAKPNLSVKRSKSLKIIRPSEEPIRDHVHLISATHINSEMPDKANFVRASISSGSSSSSHSPLETKPIKVNVKQAEIPKLQKPHKTQSSSISKKPDIPLKPNLIDTIPSTKGIYGTTRIKIGISDDSALERISKQKGDFVKYGTVNPKILNSSGTLLTRSQSHVWQPTKEQVPVRIFSDENLSQVNDCRPSPAEQKCNGESEHNVKLIRKQSLPITKLFSSKVKPLPVNNYEAPPPPKEQQRSLTLKSHTSFLEARKRLPKTNPYANYAPVNDFKEKGSGGSSLAQFHFGDSVPLLKNGNGNNTIGNSSESSSNPGTPRNSLPGTPTQSIDVLYSPISLNTYNNYPPSRSHSRPILKGSLSSTPSESDERLDLSRPPVSSSSFQNQVPTNITGPQKISSVRIPVGLRERRNSFRQAVWKEDQGPTAKSIPVENDKSENIYITTTSSVPYSVKSSAMPFHDTSLPMNTSIKPVQPRSHRDYEPIWPDPSSSTNSFRIGPTTTTTTVLINADPQTHSMINKHPHGITSAKSNNPFLIEEKTPKPIQNSFDHPKVQDRMAEIKVLLEELRAPAKVDEVRQRSMNGGASHIPLPKSTEKSSNGFSSSAFPVTPTTSTTGLKHHRSLRAPTRPQYQQSFACFTFRKPSSLESITDQLYAESNMHLARNHGKDMATSGGFETSKNPFRDDSLNQQQQNHQESTGNNHRFNDYVSLRTCRSNGKPEGNGIDSSHQIHHKVLSKSDSTPIPPPRSKRGGKMQGNDYENIRMNQNQQQQQQHQEKYWMSNGVGNGQQQPRRLHNGTSATTSIAIRKESSSSSELDMLDNHCNGDQEFSRLTSSSSIPLTNGNGGGTGATSPKAIIRALGLFQAKAANVRSRFANWTENKERSASKRNGSALNRRHDRSSERGGFNDTHPTRSTTVPPPSVAGPSSTSKHQYL